MGRSSSSRLTVVQASVNRYDFLPYKFILLKSQSFRKRVAAGEVLRHVDMDGLTQPEEDLDFTKSVQEVSVSLAICYLIFLELLAATMTYVYVKTSLAKIPYLTAVSI